MKMSDKLYDILKWISIIVLPALSTFYVVIARIWGLPYEVEIPATITAIATLLGALLGISSLNYDSEEDVQVKEIK